MNVRYTNMPFWFFDQARKAVILRCEWNAQNKPRLLL